MPPPSRLTRRTVTSERRRQRSEAQAESRFPSASQEAPGSSPVTPVPPDCAFIAERKSPGHTVQAMSADSNSILSRRSPARTQIRLPSPRLARMYSRMYEALHPSKAAVPFRRRITAGVRGSPDCGRLEGAPDVIPHSDSTRAFSSVTSCRNAVTRMPSASSARMAPSVLRQVCGP